MTNHPNPNSAAQAATNNTAQNVLTDDEINTACDWPAANTTMRAENDRAMAREVEAAVLSKLRAPASSIREAFELTYAADADDPASATELSHFTNGWRACVMSQVRAPVAGEAQERIEQMAVNRYRPVPDGKFSYKVVAGDGSRSLYTGTKDSCLRVAAKLTEAFLDGAFVASDASPQSSKDGEHGE